MAHVHNTTKASRILRFADGSSIVLAPNEAKPISAAQMKVAKRHPSMSARFKTGELALVGATAAAEPTEPTAPTEPTEPGPWFTSITNDDLGAKLEAAGFTSLDDVAAADIEALTAISGIGEPTAVKLKAAAAL